MTAETPAILDPADPRHGTPAGARAHDRAHERPCAACLAARRAYDRERRLKKNGGQLKAPGPPAVLTKAATEDVDEIVIERHLQGRACPANTAERIEIVRVWREQGRSMKELEALVRWNVYRYQRALRELQAAAA